MAKAKEGILGSFSGKVGPVVGCKGKNGYYMRALPAGGNPTRSEEQRSARSKFAVAIGLAKTLTPFFRVGYKEFAATRSSFNAAVSCILNNAVVAGADGPVVDFDKVLVSHGGLMTVEGAAVDWVGDEVRFTWQDNSGKGNAVATDVALLLVYDKASGQSFYDVNAGCRSSGTAMLQLPQGWNAETSAVYLGFRSADGEAVSNSLCLWNGDPK